jgi:hypothetical protein
MVSFSVECGTSWPHAPVALFAEEVEVFLGRLLRPLSSFTGRLTLSGYLRSFLYRGLNHKPIEWFCSSFLYLDEAHAVQRL